MYFKGSLYYQIIPHVKTKKSKSQQSLDKSASQQPKASTKVKLQSFVSSKSVEKGKVAKS